MGSTLIRVYLRGRPRSERPRRLRPPPPPVGDCRCCRATKGANGSDGAFCTELPPSEILTLMSEENIALLRRIYEVANEIGRTGDEFVDFEQVAPDLWARLAPDFELHGRPDVPDAKVYRGREASKEFWRMLQEVFAEVRREPLAFTDLGHAVVVETRIVAVGRGSDVPIEGDETDVIWFRDGQIVRLQGFPTKEQALQ